ncbi:YdcF family protein [Solihabitans fulvus]|uniref:YdcF family protein n=1 Tax=Solihabitans fulvus TaxID=1892852 RepID=UPI001F0B10D9|nr:YdcF family protein [Solihabitans fulvus]
MIVLGSGLIGDRVPPLLASRLDRAVQCERRAAAEGRDLVLVVSGGQGADEDTSEAAAMRAYLLDRGVPAERILLEDKATTTEQNLRYGMDVLTGHGVAGRVLAVTNNYHVFRTAVLSRRLGLRLNVIGARTAAYFVPSAFLREFVALLAQYWRTNLAVCVLVAAGPLLLAAAS